MLSQSEQAMTNIEDARRLRAAGLSYRQIRARLAISAGQIGHVKRALKREKAAGTRLRATTPGASARELPIGRSILPAGLRKSLMRAGCATLGDLADRFADPAAGLRTLPGIGPHRLGLVKRLLDHHELLSGSDGLQAEIESLFPEFGRDDRADDGADE